MKKFVVCIALLIAMAGVAQAKPDVVHQTTIVKASPKHAEKHSWQHWSAAPYASSQEGACRKASQAIDGFSMPQEVKKHFKAEVGKTCKGGAEAWLTPGMKREQMWAGGSKPQVMNNVTVAELPVLKSLDGRSFRKGAVADTARALEWTWEYQGKLYVLDLPYVCFNWTWGVGPVVPVKIIHEPPKIVYRTPPAPNCVEYDYDVNVGDQVRYAAITHGRMPAECWKLCDGDECSAPPAPCDECNWLRPLSVIPGGRSPNYTGRYIARHRHQRFFAPVEMKSEYFVPCVDRDGHAGDSDSWIARPEEWDGKSPYTRLHSFVYTIPYQEWPVWGVYDKLH